MNSLVVAKHELRSISRLWILLPAVLLFAILGISMVMKSSGNELNILLPFLSLAPMIFFPIIAVPYQFTMEKNEGCIESLFSTPLTAKDIWAGKVMASTLLGYVASLIISIIIIVSIYLRGFSPPLPYLIVALVVNPMVGGAIIGIFGIIQLIVPYEIAGRLALIALFSGYCYCFDPFIKILSGFSMPLELMVLIVTFIMAIFLSFIAFSLAKLLTEERVVGSKWG